MADVKKQLEQAYYIDKQINSKLEQVSSLRSIATKATTTLRVDAGGGGHDNHSMESVIAKIVDLEADINADIDKLIDLKRDIGEKVKSVQQPDSRTVLELRYLCFKKWEQIAVDMSFSMQRVYQIHEKAIAELQRLE